MKILHVIESMDPKLGGVCQAVKYTIRGLEKLGVHNEVVSFDDQECSFIKGEAIIIHGIGQGKGPWKYNSNMIPWLLKNLSRFDTIVIHGLWLYHDYASRSAIELLNKRLNFNAGDKIRIPSVFIMPHGMLDPYFQKNPKRKFKAIRNWFYWKLIQGKLIKKANGVLFTSESELQLAKTTFHPYQPKKEINIGYGIEAAPKFSYKMQEDFFKTCPQARNSPYLLFLSRINEKKGVDLLIASYKSELTNFKKNEVFPKLIIAGPGLETSFGKKLLDYVNHDSQLKDHIHFTGMLSGNAKWGAFYNCDAFILPSYQENFGIAIVEALSCAKPVLISNQVNIWQEIETNNGGIVADASLEGTKYLLQKWRALTDIEKNKMAKSALHTFTKSFSGASTSRRLLFALS